MRTEFQNVLVEHDVSVVMLTMNRPDKDHNKRLSNNSTRLANAFANARQLYLICRMKPLASD
jgi:hypothetical protein